VGFVVGLPIHADGSESKMSVEAKKFGGWLATVTGLPVVFQDEHRFTSIEAAGKLAGHRVLHAAGRRPAPTPSPPRSCFRLARRATAGTIDQPRSLHD